MRDAGRVRQAAGEKKRRHLKRRDHPILGAKPKTRKGSHREPAPLDRLSLASRAKATSKYNAWRYFAMRPCDRDCEGGWPGFSVPALPR